MPTTTEDIPFVRQVGIVRNADGRLELPSSAAVHNHLGTVHASAQAALAETASGDLLGRAFPELVDKVVPVLRAARTRYRKPATGTLTAYPSLAEAARADLLDQLARKGRALVSVEVALRDPAGEITCQAAFDWFVARLEA